MKKSKHREFLEQQILPQLSNEKGNVLFVGFRKPQKFYKNYFLCANRYDTLDIDISAKPTIVSDICRVSISDKSYDLVLFLGVYFQLLDPFGAMKEVFRILRDNGKLLFNVPYLLKQKQERIIDLWRVTPNGVRFLLKDYFIQEFWNLHTHLFVLAKKKNV